MNVSGRFNVKLEPQEDASFPVGRMTIEKSYSGGLVGRGIGQMISKRTQGVSVYSAIEEFDGELEGKKGSFTLFHHGIMSSEQEELKIVIIAGSGTGELENISGELEISRQGTEHQYTLNYLVAK